MSNKKLAIHGGPQSVDPNFTFKRWPEITALDEEYVLASLRQSNHAWGPNCVALQEEFAKWNGNAFCAATNSGTAALHMAMVACGIGPGDEVITTTTSWTSTATSIMHHNAIPVFAEIDWDTMLIDPAKIEERITDRTKAILVVHYWGLACDMDPIMEIAKKHKLYVIEDACQAHGALYRGRKVGTIGHCAAFSLNQNKNFCAGEGGLFVTNDEEMYKNARALMTFGEMKAPEEQRDFHSYAMGWMHRMNDLTAAFARSQLLRLAENNEWARKNWRRLQDGLQGIKGLKAPISNDKQTTCGYAFVIRVAPEEAGLKCTTEIMRDAVVEAIKAEGVPVAGSRYVLPAHTVFQAKNGYGGGCPWTCHMVSHPVDYSLDQYPVTNRNRDASIQIDLYSHRPPNGEEAIDQIVAAIRKVFDNLDELKLD